MAHAESHGRWGLKPLVAAIALTVPWPIVRLSGLGSGLGLVSTVLLSGVSILGAAFLLAWGAETAEKDVSRSFAIAVLAVLAVAPEYAVDALYAWEAGADPGSPASNEAAQLAVANMTGANRLLIGIGWSTIALLAISRAVKSGDPIVEQRRGFLADRVHLDMGISLELVFLLAATLYAFTIPFSGSLSGLDMLVLVGLYAGYIVMAIRASHSPETHSGVPAILQRLSRPGRILSVLALFGFGGTVILLAVEPFAHGLEDLGRAVGISPFLVIQWIAPLASESPEFIVAILLVLKARSDAAFNAIISSKLNQWTLLIGTLVLVYTISLGTYGALPLEARQSGEIWLTAAQSYFAVALIVDRTLSVREAIALLVLFAIQLLYPTFHEYEWLLAFSGLYILLGTVLFVHRRAALRKLIANVRRVPELEHAR